MAKNPAYQFYAADFLTLTSSWDPGEVGIYMRLRASQWINGYLPNDKARLARIAGVSADDLGNAWVFIGLQFALCEDGFLRDLELEEYRSKKGSFIQRQSENGKKGGRPRKNEEEKPKENPNLHFGLTQNESQKKPLEEEDEKEDEVEEEKEDEVKFAAGKFLIRDMLSEFKISVPEYGDDEDYDFPPLGEISRYIAGQEGITRDPAYDSEAADKILLAWRQLCPVISADKFYRNQSLKTISNHIQTIVQKAKNGNRNPIQSQAASLVDAQSVFAEFAAARGKRGPNGSFGSS